MPTIGSETYRSSVPPDSPTKETKLSDSHAHSSAIKGEDYGALVPSVTEIAPTSAGTADPDFDLVVTGTGFELFSIINWNGGDELTEYVSGTELKTLVKPSTVQAPLPFVLPVYVHNGDLKSNVVEFTFVEVEAVRKKEAVHLEPKRETKHSQHQTHAKDQTHKHGRHS